MKRNTKHRKNPKIIPYCPYVKDRRYYVEKLVDWTLAAITSVGALTALLFLMLL